MVTEGAQLAGTTQQAVDDERLINVCELLTEQLSLLMKSMTAPV